MHQRRLSVFASLLLALTTLVGLSATSASAAQGGTVVVSGDTTNTYNDAGEWWFNRDDSTSTPFVIDTDTASIGTGSLHVLPIGPDAADKFIGEYFVLEDVSDVVSISYDFAVGPNGDENDDADQFYANVYANFAGGDQGRFGDCVFNVVPDTSSGWTTQTFDPTASYDVRTRSSAPGTCPGSPSDLPAGSTIRMFVLNLGDTSTADVGLDGYFDNVVLTTSENTTVYDFEPRGDVFCDGVLATQVGTDGDDELIGGPGVDVIAGLGGNDKIVGLGGDDILCGGLGNDELIGNFGNDRLFGGDNDDVAYAGPGNDRVEGNSGIDELFGQDGEDELFGGSEDDLVVGGNQNDLILGGSGDDELSGGNGADKIIGGGGEDDIAGGNGNDRLFGTDGDDTINGDGGNDFLFGSTGEDTLDGGAGFDRTNGGADFDVCAGERQFSCENIPPEPV